MTREWQLTAGAFAWDEAACRAVTLQTIDAIFAEEAVKVWLREML
jgi:hypothetical protein